ncbi:MAG TPA: hypothetical protein VFR76_05935, partial [Verrucomicrobiae bacterium]|nr:hypothetical protein [Verrucomicrobiae bacterium]
MNSSSARRGKLDAKVRSQPVPDILLCAVVKAELWYQMFNLYVMMQWPMNQVKKTLGVSAAQVYMAKMRISRLIKSEVRTAGEEND